VAADGIATRVKLLPWTLYVQHEEVRFPTGSSDIPSGEAPKLDASYQKLIEAVERARKADPKLAARVFIAGHTDTVGSAEENRKLSLARARSIAAWFRESWPALAAQLLRRLWRGGPQGQDSRQCRRARQSTGGLHPRRSKSHRYVAESQLLGIHCKVLAGPMPDTFFDDLSRAISDGGGSQELLEALARGVPGAGFAFADSVGGAWVVIASVDPGPPVNTTLPLDAQLLPLKLRGQLFGMLPLLAPRPRAQRRRSSS